MDIFKERILTQSQTASSKQKNNQPHEGRSRSVAKKVKGESKFINDKLTTASLRKSKLSKEKMFMVQSLNIPHLSPLSQNLRSSQQLSTNLIDNSLFVPSSLSDMLSRTQNTLDKYQKTCNHLRQEKKSLESELTRTKNYIAELERQILKRKGRKWYSSNIYRSLNILIITRVLLLELLQLLLHSLDLLLMELKHYYLIIILFSGFNFIIILLFFLELFFGLSLTL